MPSHLNPSFHVPYNRSVRFLPQILFLELYFILLEIFFDEIIHVLLITERDKHFNLAKFFLPTKESVLNFKFVTSQAICYSMPHKPNRFFHATYKLTIRYDEIPE